MNMFTKLLETLGNNFWLIIILCLEVILAVWLLCFARGKKKKSCRRAGWPQRAGRAHARLI